MPQQGSGRGDPGPDRCRVQAKVEDEGRIVISLNAATNAPAGAGICPGDTDPSDRSRLRQSGAARFIASAAPFRD
jgi:hypothetical protein